MNILQLVRRGFPSFRGQRRDEGLTLVETLITAALTGVVLLIVSTMTISALRTVRGVRGTTNSTADARTASQAVTKALRVAVTPDDTTPAFAQATARSVSFYSSMLRGSDVGNVALPIPTLVSYTVDTSRNCLLETKTPGVSGTPPTWPASGTASTCLARGTINIDGTPIFAYFDSSGAVLTPTATGLSVADRGRVASVTVQLAVTPAGDGKTSTARTSVVMVNLGDN
ncbi:type II secretion system protein J [Kineococcus sp. DHX-1]|uniref:PulJ/GspJ family protein n=1 Tax=Kineococcus sp. DHX-1 TaxID=3349638 RepID=UPI0036D3B161